MIVVKAVVANRAHPFILSMFLQELPLWLAGSTGNLSRQPVDRDQVFGTRRGPSSNCHFVQVLVWEGPVDEVPAEKFATLVAGLPALSLLLLSDNLQVHRTGCHCDSQRLYGGTPTHLHCEGCGWNNDLLPMRMAIVKTINVMVARVCRPCSAAAQEAATEMAAAVGISHYRSFQHDTL